LPLEPMREVIPVHPAPQDSETQRPSVEGIGKPMAQSKRRKIFAIRESDWLQNLRKESGLSG
jgi:hypothetical protein